MPPSYRAYSAGLPRRTPRVRPWPPRPPGRAGLRHFSARHRTGFRRVRHPGRGGSARDLFFRGGSPRFRSTVFADRLSHRSPSPGKTPWASATRQSFPQRATPTFGQRPCTCPAMGITHDQMQPPYWFRGATPTPRLSGPITFPTCFHTAGRPAS